jgi:signal recognition particle subunit SEC65
MKMKDNGNTQKRKGRGLVQRLTPESIEKKRVRYAARDIAYLTATYYQLSKCSNPASKAKLAGEFRLRMNELEDKLEKYSPDNWQRNDIIYEAYEEGFETFCLEAGKPITDYLSDNKEYFPKALEVVGGLQ